MGAWVVRENPPAKKPPRTEWLIRIIMVLAAGLVCAGAGAAVGALWNVIQSTHGSSYVARERARYSLVD
jgi:hypothetical protein